MKRFLKIIITIVAVLIIGLIVMMVITDHKKLKILENESTKVYEPSFTTLNFPLLISVKDIEKLANARIKKVIVDKKIPLKDGNDTLFLKVTRLGDLNFRMNNEYLNTSVPLKLEIQYLKKFIGKKNISFFKKEPLSLFISATFRSSIDLQENMQILSKTSLSEIIWNEEPNIKVLGIEFNLKDKINELMLEKSAEIAGKLDAQIKEKINLKKPTEKIWNNIQKSIKANKENGLFVRVKPQNLAVFIDKSLNDSLKLDLIVTAKIYARFASDTNQIAKVPFPSKIKVLKKFKDENSKIQLHGLFPLQKLNQILREKLEGKSFDVKGFNVKIKKIQVINGTRNFYVRIKHGGDISGEILVKGFPKLSKDKKKISIENVFFENKLDDQVFNSFTDLLHEQIMILLKENVEFDVAKIMESIPDYARTALDKSKLSKKADVTLDHLEIEKVKIDLTKDNIQIMVSGQTNFQIALKKTSFKYKKPA